jgi:hypothetical protein
MQCCAATAQSLHLTSVTGKTFFLEFACNLRSHCFGEGTRIEHFSDFGGFCSTFETARPNFGEPSRQKWGISIGFCLLPGPRTTILESPVDKNQTFTPVFVYFRGRAPKFARNYQRCYKSYVKSKTLPNSVTNSTAFPTKRDFIHLFPKMPKNAGPICRCVIIIIFI